MYYDRYTKCNIGMREKKYLMFLLSMVSLATLNLILFNDLRSLKWSILQISEKQKTENRPETNKITDFNKFHRPRVSVREDYPIVISQPYKLNNKDLCKGVEKVSTIVMVHTAPKHFIRRRTLRETFLNATYFSPENIRVIFLLGLVLDSKIQVKLENESKIYKDIVQGYFIDSYRNLSNKGVLGYKWISEHCMNAEFVTKIDDDVFINFFKVFEEMHYLKRKTKYILCNRIGKDRMIITRKKLSKWFVHEDEYKGRQTYPHTYCSGCAVFISTDLIPLMYQASISTPFFWVDDFYLFGLLPSKVPGVIHNKLKSRLNFNYLKAQKCFEKYGSKCSHAVIYVSSYGDKGFRKLWQKVVKDRYQSIYGNYYMDLPSFPNQKVKPLSVLHF